MRVEGTESPGADCVHGMVMGREQEMGWSLEGMWVKNVFECNTVISQNFFGNFENFWKFRPWILAFWITAQYSPLKIRWWGAKSIAVWTLPLLSTGHGTCRTEWESIPYFWAPTVHQPVWKVLGREWWIRLRLVTKELQASELNETIYTHYCIWHKC